MTNRELLTSEETRRTAFSPELAKRIGLNECIFLSQLQYWINMKEKNDDMSTFRDGRMWVYNSYESWMNQFPYWSKNTLIRTIKHLEDMGIVITGNYNKMSLDKTTWYTIDYDELDAIGKKDDTNASGQNDRIDTAKLDTRYTQNECIDIPKMGTWYTQNGQTNTIEYNKENNKEDIILNGALDNARCNSDFHPKDVDSIREDASYPKDVINYDILRKEISKSLDHNNVYDSYCRTEITNIIVYFYHRYRDYFGVDHPCISQSCMDNVVCDLLADPSGVLDISTEIYAPLIDQYFETELSCDYRIMHFMSGQIREFRNYETGGV